MFLSHDSFETLEVQIKKKFTKSVETSKSGGCYSKHYLEIKERWTKSKYPSLYVYCEPHFYTKGYDSESRGLGQIKDKHRVSSVHGEGEIYLVLNETFEATDKHEEETNRQGNMKVEVRFQSLHGCIH